jgi:DNA end-binding protein Ku
MRPIWNGSLSFGLINIPVRLYSASLDRALSFKLFDKHGNCPVSYVKICRSNHKEIPKEDIVRGYEYQKGDYVILDEKDFKKVAREKSDLIDILQFSDQKEIDTKYYEKPYYIEPAKKAEKAYSLLSHALEESGKLAVARFVMREKEHIGIIKPENGILILHRLRYADEIRKPEIDLPKKNMYSKAELEMALALIKQLTKKFDPTKYKDTYSDELRDIIKAKAKGKKIKRLESKETPADTNMKDLMRMLRKSLEEKTGKKVRVSAK